jgi:hypothetical protein
MLERWLARYDSLFSKDDFTSTYRISSWLFLRALALVYLVAFASLWPQLGGLIGSEGILPLGDYLDRAREALSAEAYWKLPTLFWIDASDAALHLVCLLGMVVALVALAGFASPLCFFLLWLLYLSLTVAGQVFLSFQWDILLLEAGFLAIFLGPWSWKRHRLSNYKPSLIPVFLIQWLLVRLMLLSGIVKLMAPEPNTWHDLTALSYHYMTQPLPPWTAWFFHHLPLWFHQASCLIMFIIEIPVAVLLLGPRRIRHVAALLQMALMLVVIISGNYGFFNYLTMALALMCLSDSFYAGMGKWFRAPVSDLEQLKPLSRWALIPLLVVTLLMTSIAFGQRTQLISRDSFLSEIHRWTASFHLFNSYGLFASMTTERPEVAIEGSMDGKEWKEYEFRWKIDRLEEKPKFVAPYHPRLDWQMWFAALRPDIRYAPWVRNLMVRILEDSQPVMGLMGEDPFPDGPPRYIRARVYDYQFTSPPERVEAGCWWERHDLRPYSLPLERRRNPLP